MVRSGCNELNHITFPRKRLFRVKLGRYARGAFRAVLEASTDAIEIDVDHRSAEQGQGLLHDQAADNGPTQGLAELRPGAVPQDHGQAAEKGARGGHQDRTQPLV